MKYFVEISPDDIRRLHVVLQEHGGIAVAEEISGIRVSLMLAVISVGGFPMYVAYDCVTGVQSSDSRLELLLKQLNVLQLSALSGHILNLPDTHWKMA